MQGGKLQSNLVICGLAGKSKAERLSGAAVLPGVVFHSLIQK